MSRMYSRGVCVRKSVFIGVLFFSLSVWAKEGVDIIDYITPLFSQGVQIEKKQFTLSPKELKAVQNEAHASLDSNMIRLYTVKNTTQTEGYAVLVVKKIRTKNAVILYVVDTYYRIKSTEIVFFAEPVEYKPTAKWLQILEGKTQKDNLYASKGIPIISGATLSSRALSDAARIALILVKCYTK